MRLNTLDALRGFFAIMIVLLHMTNQSHLVYFRFIRNSDIFVEFFFVLSGFVIALSADGRVNDLRTAAVFIIRRIGRIGPLNLVMLAAFVSLMLVKALASQLHILYAEDTFETRDMVVFAFQNLFLVQAFRNETVVWLNFPSWSISAELWAYVLFAIFCIACKRCLPKLSAVAVVLSFLVLIEVLEPGFGHFTDMGLFRCICRFFLGYFTYLIWKKIQHFQLIGANMMETAAIGAVFIATYFSDIYLVKMVEPLIFAVSILIFAFQAGFISGILCGKVFSNLGAWSYSIYMVHALVLSLSGLFVRRVEHMFNLKLSSPSRVASINVDLLDFGNPYIMDMYSIALVIVVILVARLTHRFVEMPGQVYSKRLADRWFPAPSATSAQ